MSRRGNCYDNAVAESLRELKILCQSDIINIIRIDRDERYKSTI